MYIKHSERKKWDIFQLNLNKIILPAYSVMSSVLDLNQVGQCKLTDLFLKSSLSNMSFLMNQ